MHKDIAFCQLQENLEINMEKKLMDNATKTGLDTAKSATKGLFQKTAETTGNLIGNKTANKITSVGKSKNKQKEKEDAINEVEEIYIPPEKRQQIINDFKLL